MHTATLRNVGGSTMLALPPSLLNMLDLKAGVMVGISIEEGHLVINPISRPTYTLEQLLSMSVDTVVGTPVSPQEREWLDAPAIGEELL